MQSRSIGWGTEDAAGAEGREEGDEVAAVEMMARGQDENVWLVVALGCVSQNLLH